MNPQSFGPLAIEILTILTDPKTDDKRMTSAAIYARSYVASAQVQVSQTLHNLFSKLSPLVEKYKGAAGTLWRITDAGVARLNGDPAPEAAPAVKKTPRASKAAEALEDTEEATEEATEETLDVAVWMSGDVSIIQGDLNITMNSADAGRMLDYLGDNLHAMRFADRIVALVMDRITAKLFDHPDDRRAPSPFMAVDQGNNDQSACVQPNKFEAFLNQSRAPISTDANCANAAPTEPVGLPGVELDGPGGIAGIHIPVFGQAPETMTREEQFAETAARG